MFQSDETEMESILAKALADESEIPPMPSRLHGRVVRGIMRRRFAGRTVRSLTAVALLGGFAAFGGMLVETISDYQALKVKAEGKQEMKTCIKTTMVAMGTVVAGMTAWSDQEVVVDNDRTTARWNRATTEVVPLPVYWDWEWVPSSAAAAEISVSEGSRTVFSASVARTDGDVTTLFELPSTEEMNRYLATISFSDISGKPVGESVSVPIDVFPGSFGKAVINGHKPTDAKWQRVSNRRFFVPYSGSWRGVFPETAALTISVGGTVLKTLPLSSGEGLAEIDLKKLGNGPFDVTVDFGDEQQAPLSGTICFVRGGSVFLVR